MPAVYALEPSRNDCSLAVSSSSSSRSDDGISVDDEPDRTASTDWCSCTRCSRMPTVDECKCCREMGDICHRIGDLECITKHPKFTIICLEKIVVVVKLAVAVAAVVVTTVCQATTNHTGRHRLTGVPALAARGCQPSMNASVAEKWATLVIEW